MKKNKLERAYNKALKAVKDLSAEEAVTVLDAVTRGWSAFHRLSDCYEVSIQSPKKQTEDQIDKIDKALAKETRKKTNRKK